MIEFIFQYAITFFTEIMIIAFYLLFTLDRRRARRLRVPRFFAEDWSNGRYFACMSWIALFFAAHFLFSYQEPQLHWCSIPFFIISFLYLLLYRRRVEGMKFRGFK